MKENNFQIIGGATTEDAIRSAVTVFSRKIDEILAKKERAVVGGAAGRMLESFYHALRHEPIAWHKVDLFMLDERLVPFYHPESNARMIFETLVQPLISDGRPQTAAPTYQCIAEPSSWQPILTGFHLGRNETRCLCPFSRPRHKLGAVSSQDPLSHEKRFACDAFYADMLTYVRT